MSTILIRDGSVLTPSGWLQPGYVLVDEELITAVEEGSPPSGLEVGEVISARHTAVIPGLINGHTHLSQTFMRGLGGGRTLLRWLKERIWPLQEAISPEQLKLAALLGLVENLRCGATEVIDHHKIVTTTAHTEAVCEAAEMIGLRVTVARSWADRGANAESQASILAAFERLYEQQNEGRKHLRIANGPISTWRCSAEMLIATHELSQRYGAPTHIHVSENHNEVQISLDESRMRPVTWLDSIGVLDENTQVVHAVWLDDSEIDLLSKRGAIVIHCPVSNAVLGSGIAPLAELMHRGIRVRLGTDGSASNDTQDIWETIKAALLFSRATSKDATIISPADSLSMALTTDGLQSGYPADITIVRLDHSRAMPVHDLSSALTLCTHGCDVDTVIVDGKILMKGKRVLVVDEDALLQECRRAIKHLRHQAGLE